MHFLFVHLPFGSKAVADGKLSQKKAGKFSTEVGKLVAEAAKSFKAIKHALEFRVYTWLRNPGSSV